VAAQDDGWTCPKLERRSWGPDRPKASRHRRVWWQGGHNWLSLNPAKGWSWGPAGCFWFGLTERPRLPNLTRQLGTTAPRAEAVEEETSVDLRRKSQGPEWAFGASAGRCCAQPPGGGRAAIVAFLPTGLSPQTPRRSQHRKGPRRRNRRARSPCRIWQQPADYAPARSCFALCEGGRAPPTSTTRCCWAAEKELAADARLKEMNVPATSVSRQHADRDANCLPTTGRRAGSPFPGAFALAKLEPVRARMYWS